MFLNGVEWFDSGLIQLLLQMVLIYKKGINITEVIVDEDSGPVPLTTQCSTGLSTIVMVAPKIVRFTFS